MKNLTLLLLMLLFMHAPVIAQTVVIEDVPFDYYQSSSDNDFVNHFSNGNGLSQIQNNGITGGCLLTPDSINWGNDNAIYCSQYKPVAGDTTITAICFKYDSAGALPGSFQRAISIWLIPNADFNHYVVASVTGNKKIEMLTYSWNNNPYPNLALLHDHWYRYVLSAVFIGGGSYNVFLKAEVFDLGINGLIIPSLVNSSSGTINDSILVADTAIHASVTGTLHGGAVYLDNFHFEGREGYSNCINTPMAIHDEISPGSLHVYPAPALNTIFIRRNSMDSEMMNIRIYDMAGRKQAEINTTEKKTEMDISFLSEGMYFLQCRTASRLWTTKVMVAR